MQTIQLTKPDDCHLHLRDGTMLTAVLADSAKQFARAVIMPNLDPPILTVADAKSYRQRILSALDDDSFKPMMTLYLTDHTSADEISQAATCDEIVAVKYYPAGATTHSSRGVTAMNKVYPLLEVMAECKMPLLIHGEVTDKEIDIFDREAIFIERELIPLIEHLPDLKIVLEHISTKQAVSFIEESADNIAATITPQHITLNRNALFQNGLRPHHYCLPILKAEQHRQAVLDAATSGNPKFFLGTDSAPHDRMMKEQSCGCAGIYSAYAALCYYAEMFESAGSLDRLEGFASHHGANFYGWEQNKTTITLVKKPWTIPDELPCHQTTIIPFRAEETCQWQIKIS